MTARKAGVLAVNLPPGAQTWVDFGGAMAVTPEAEATYVLENVLATLWWLHAGKKGERPQMRDYPPYANPKVAVPDKAAAQAERWRKREQERLRRLAAEEQ